MSDSPEDRLRQRGGRTKIAQINGESASPASDVAPLYTLTLRECAMQPALGYVWKNYIRPGHFCLLIAAPGSGKSAVAPFMGIAISLGKMLFGQRTRAVTVLYVAAEDGSGMKMRCKALFERDGDAPNFHLHPEPVDFLTPASDSVARLEATIALLKPGLVIVDTVIRSFPALKENDPGDMGHVVKTCRGFTTICNSAVLALHHPPKGQETARGHSILEGDVDLTMFIDGTRTQARNVTVGKNRSGPSDLSFGFSIHSHVFPELDEDGDTVSAPVIEPSESVVAADNAAKIARLKDKPALVLRELKGLLDADGAMVCPGPDYPVVRAVERSALRRRLIERGFFPESALCVALNKPLELGRPGYAVENNALTPLKAKGLVSFNRLWIWLL